MSDPYEAAIESVIQARKISEARQAAEQEKKERDQAAARAAEERRQVEIKAKQVSIWAELDKFVEAANRRETELGVKIASVELSLSTADAVARREWRCSFQDGSVFRNVEFSVMKDGSFQTLIDGQPRSGKVDITTIEPDRFAIGFSGVFQAIMNTGQLSSAIRQSTLDRHASPFRLKP